MACRYSRGRGISIHRPPDDEYQLNIYTSHRVYLPKFFMMFAYTMLVRLGLGVPWYVPTDLSRNVFEVGFEAFSRGSTDAADEI